MVLQKIFHHNIYLGTILAHCVVCKLTFSSALLFRLFRIKVHNNFAQANDVFADDAVVESTNGPIDASRIRKRIYSGILEGIYLDTENHRIIQM